MIGTPLGMFFGHPMPLSSLSHHVGDASLCRRKLFEPCVLWITISGQRGANMLLDSRASFPEPALGCRHLPQRGFWLRRLSLEQLTK